MASSAIGILFEVDGGGNIDGASGRRIRGQLSQIVGQINKSEITKLKFTADIASFRQELENLKTTINQISGGGGSGRSSRLSAEFLNATQSARTYYDLLMKIEKAKTRTTEITGDMNTGYQFSGSSVKYQTLVEQTNRARQEFQRFTTDVKKSNMSLQEFANFTDLISTSQNKLELVKSDSAARAQEAWGGLTAKVNDYIDRVEYAASRDPRAAKMLAELRTTATYGKANDFDRLKQQYREVEQYINKNALAQETWYQKMRKTFGTRMRSMIAGFIVGGLFRSLRTLYTNVLDVDTAMTQLRIVTGESDQALSRFSNSVAKAVQRIGTSMSDLVDSTTTFARLGYSLNEASNLAEMTAAYSKVGDVSVDDATKNITGIIKAYKIGAKDIEGVIDKLIYVGNKFPISSAEIGEGMNNAASSLYSNGNTLNQALGILSASNTTVQNISRASTAVRTFAARLSASKGELVELGEDTTGVETVAKLRDSMGAFGIQIEDGNGQLKSTYEIVEQIADKWSTFTDEEKSSIATLAAGTRQQDIFYSLINNFDDARKIVNDVDNATGSLASATETRLDSIQGRLDQLKATWQQMSTSFLSSGLVKSVISAVDKLLQGFSKVGGLKTLLMTITSIVVMFSMRDIGGGILNLITKFNNLGVSLKNLKGISFNVITAFKNMRSAQAALATAQSAATSATTGEVIATESLKDAEIAATTTTETFKVAVGGIIGIASLVITALMALAGWLKQERQEAEEAKQAAVDNFLAEQENAINLIKLYNTYKDMTPEMENYKSIEEDIVALLKDKDGILKDLSQDTDEYRKAVENLSKAQIAGYLSDSELAKEDAAEILKKAGDKAHWKGLSWEFAAEVNNKRANGPYIDPDVVRRLGFKVRNNREYISPSQYTDTYGFSAEYFNGLKYGTAEYAAQEYKLYSQLAEKLRGALVEEYVNNGESDTYKLYLEYIKESENRVADIKDAAEKYIEVADKVSYYQSIINSTLDDDNNEANKTQVLIESIPSILEKIQPGFDGIAKALENVDKQGALTSESLSQLLTLEEKGQLYGLKLYDINDRNNSLLIRTADGYKLSGNALEKYVQTIMDATMAVNAFASIQDRRNMAENVKNTVSVIKTLLAAYTSESSSASRRDTKENLEDQKDALNKVLDKYKKLIDIRKKLLKSYEDEQKYRKELEKKQNNVAKLEQQLAVAQFDNSAAGQARSRSLSDQLTEARDELDEFTLEHAIEVITDDLDEQYDEYKKFIDDEVDKIEKAIKNETGSTSGEPSASIVSVLKSILTKLEEWEEQLNKGLYIEHAQPVVKGKEKETGWRMYTYHSGGVVGNTKLESNEEFAKLLKGEVVATPEQIKRFMGTTLPTIAGAGGGVFNAPLVSIQAESITPEAMPKLEAVVDGAVTEIKKLFESGMSRSGYKGNTKRLLI